MRPPFLLLSCEHARARVPVAWSALFWGREELLASHRGFDPGALSCARTLARRLSAPLHAATVTRLLCDLNRSVGHPRLFSEVTRGLPPEQRERILRRYYHPYREALEAAVARRSGRGRRVLHLSVHSFTPVLEGQQRQADLGLLYDPSRSAEARFARQWRALLQEACPDLRVRRNDPYRGTADGLTTHLRRRFGQARYLGLELEINQRLVGPGERGWQLLQQQVARSLRHALGRSPSRRRRASGTAGRG